MTMLLPTTLHRIVLVAACGLAVATVGAAPAQSSTAAPVAATLASDPTLAAAGDIIGGCSTSPCPYQQTAAVVSSLNPTTVLALGDISNGSGSASDYTGPFDSSWGAYKAKIRPVPGNHDYGAPGAVNYFNYFGAAAAPPLGYYSYDVGTWHIVAINSNCSQVGGCQAGSAQELWLKSDLAQHPAACTLAFWHHPRYSSGYGGDNTSMSDMFQDLYNARADVLLSGHSHDYERFAPQNNASQLDTANGITQFVVGTGGSGFTGFSAAKPNSLVRNNTTWGALNITLGANSYSYQFVPVAGKTFTDSGSAACHRGGGGGGDTTAPSAPTGLTATATSSTSVSLGWTASTDNVGVTGYRIYRGSGGATPSLLTTVSGTQTAYTDTSAAAATSYTYQVSAIDAAGNESQKASVSVTTPGGGTGTTLTFPVTDDATISQASPATNYGSATRLVADHSPVNDFLTKFTVSGTAGCQITGAQLRLTVGSTSEDNSVHGGDVFGVTSTAWSQGTVTWNTAPAPAGSAVASLGAVALNTTYLVNVTPLVTGDGVVTIRVSNTSSDGVRYFSREGSTTQAPQLQVTCGGGGGDTTAPSAPTGLTATATSSTSVSLGWTASTDNVGVTGYRIYRGSGGATPSLLTTVSGTQTAYTDTSAAAATSYTYQVSAIDAAGNESQKASVSVTTPGGGTGTTLTFPVTDDATISQASPATNYGSATRLVADHSPVNDFLTKFTVSGTAGCQITGAQLRLTVGSTSEDNSVHGGDVFGVTSTAWSQGTVTWNTAPAPAGSAVASLGAVALNTTYLVNVTPLVTGDGVVTIRVSNTSSDGVRYFSREGSTTQAPQLQVTCG